MRAGKRRTKQIGVKPTQKAEKTQTHSGLNSFLRGKGKARGCGLDEAVAGAGAALEGEDDPPSGALWVLAGGERDSSGLRVGQDQLLQESLALGMVAENRLAELALFGDLDGRAPLVGEFFGRDIDRRRRRSSGRALRGACAATTSTTSTITTANIITTTTAGTTTATTRSSPVSYTHLTLPTTPYV